MGTAERVTEAPTVRVRWYALVALVGHLVLVIVGAAALWRIAGGGGLGLGVTIGFVLGYTLLWRFWLAPGSRMRLEERERLALTLVLAPTVVVVAALGELWLTALIGGSFVLLGDALDQHRR